MLVPLRINFLPFVQTRDRHDLVIVQEKLDGSNVGIARLNGEILALTRAGYLAPPCPGSSTTTLASGLRKIRVVSWLSCAMVNGCVTSGA